MSKLVNFKKIDSNSVLQHLFLEGTKKVPLIINVDDKVEDIPQCHIYYKIEEQEDENVYNVYDIACSIRGDYVVLEEDDFRFITDDENMFIQHCIGVFTDFYYDNIKEEDATQASAFGGRVSLFGDKDNVNFNYNDWYNQLFELKDYDTITKHLKVKTIKTYDTGGHTMVECGQLEDGNYFVINEETLVITDADYEEAFDQPDVDMGQWFKEHEINTYDADFDEEYKIVANQTSLFKVNDDEE